MTFLTQYLFYLYEGASGFKRTKLMKTDFCIFCNPELPPKSFLEDCCCFSGYPDHISSLFLKFLVYLLCVIVSVCSCWYDHCAVNINIVTVNENGNIVLHSMYGNCWSVFVFKKGNLFAVTCVKKHVYMVKRCIVCEWVKDNSKRCVCQLMSMANI